MPMKLIKMPVVMNRVAMSRTNLFIKVKEGTFPAPISLGARAIAWVEEEVDEWVAARIAASRTSVAKKKSKAVAQ